MKKRFARKLVVITSLAMMAMLAGCGKEEKDTSKGTEKESTTSASTEAKGEEDEEDYNTGDASLDKVRNEDGRDNSDVLRDTHDEGHYGIQLHHRKLRRRMGGR